MDDRFSGFGAWILYAITIAMMIFIMAPLLLVMAVSVSEWRCRSPTRIS
jgi:putative spermidine/putrescine transport system permease protein